jgi:hypothetical protein
VHLACVFMTGVLSACDAAPTAGVAPEPQPPAAAPQQQTVARVVVQPERATLVPGDTLPASAVAQDSSGSALPGRVVMWASTDTNIAVVSSDGKIGARSAGRVSIVAIADTARGVIDVEVLPPPADTAATPPPPPPVTPTPSFTEIVRGVRPRGFGQGSYALLSPAGGRSLWVAPDGNDANAGSSDAPFRTITRAAQVAAAGDVVTIRAGTYNESVVVANSGTPDRRIVFQAERRGEVVLTGPGRSFRPATWSGGVQNTGQLYVTVRGLVFRAYAGTNSVPPGPDFPAALKMARGWLAEDCLFDRAGWTAISIEGNDAVVARSTIQYSHMYALSAWAPANGAESPTDPRYKPLDGIRLVDLVLRGNHTDATAQTATNAAFSSKFMATRGTLLDNIESYENVGPGFWFDGRNSHFTVRNSYFHHNRDFGATEAHNGRGLNLEINWAPGLVERNVFIGNAGTAVAVTNSQGVEVRDNLMVGNLQCVTLVNAARGTTSSGAPLFPTRDIGIFGNSCKDWKVTGAMHTWGGSFEPPAEMNIRADRNVYEPVTSRTLVWWQELGGVTTLSAARSTFGWEANGSIAPVPWP